MSHYESGQLITLVMDRVDDLSMVYATVGVEMLEVSLVNGELIFSVMMPGDARYIDSTIEVII